MKWCGVTDVFEAGCGVCIPGMIPSAPHTDMAEAVWEARRA